MSSATLANADTTNLPEGVVKEVIVKYIISDETIASFLYIKDANAYLGRDGLSQNFADTDAINAAVAEISEKGVDGLTITLDEAKRMADFRNRQRASGATRSAGSSSAGGGVTGGGKSKPRLRSDRKAALQALVAEDLSKEDIMTAMLRKYPELRDKLTDDLLGEWLEKL